MQRLRRPSRGHQILGQVTIPLPYVCWWEMHVVRRCLQLNIGCLFAEPWSLCPFAGALGGEKQVQASAPTSRPYAVAEQAKQTLSAIQPSQLAQQQLQQHPQAVRWTQASYLVPPPALMVVHGLGIA